MTNKDEFTLSMERAAARKAAFDALPPEGHAFLEALRHRWFPMGKTEDYEIVKKILIGAYVK